MTTLELLTYLADRGVRLWLDGDQLRYRAPSDVVTPELIQKLTEHKATIVAMLRRRQSQAGAQPPAAAIPLAPRDGALPLASSQERLWFLAQLRPDSAVYTMPIAFRIEGRLDVALLRRTFQALVRRHEILRTTFAVVDDAPVQVVAPIAAPPLPLLDLAGLGPAAREDLVGALLRDEAGRPFDLARGPLLRARLLRVAPDAHILLLTMHHIVCDGWSLGIVIREISEIYRAYAAGAPPTLPRLPIQYADYAVWQRQWLQGAAMGQQLAYWQAQLADLTTLSLPTARPRPAIQGFRGASHDVVLGTDLTARLVALGQAAGVTPFMVLLAALATLLHRYSGQDDIVVGTPIAGRTHQELEGLVGCFINTLVLRTSLAGNPSFRDLLARVSAVALAAYTHQELPFERLVDELQPLRDLSYNPLFQVALTFHNASLAPLALAGLTVRMLDVSSSAARFDLWFNFWDDPAGIRGFIEYNTDLFDADTIARMATHLQRVLEAMAADPARRVGDLCLPADAERQQLAAWGTARRAAAPAEPLPRRFEDQAARRPDALAVVYEDQHMTYAALSARANRLARALRRRGVAQHGRVGLCVERSLELVVGLLGILKAGAGYVPLDPAYPKDRLRFMLDDSQAPEVLTQTRLRDALPELLAQALCIDADWAQIARESPEDSGAALAADQLAYIIYTSGSTGQPKGTLISHAQVSGLFRATEPWFVFGEDDVWTLFHSYAFDFSVWEYWGALLYGGRLVVVPYAVSRSPEDFYQLIVAQRVSMLNQTPSAFRQLMQVDERRASQGLGLRQVIFGGEALDIHSLQPWFARHGDQRPRLVNMYGITETTVHVTYRPLTRDDLGSAAKSLIGAPIPDLHLYILDRYLQLAPIGIPGEMFVGGRGVAQGYLNRPDLTAERFIPNPFGTLNDERRTMNGETILKAPFSVQRSEFRLYRTGDLARYLPGGDIEYLGRIDHQIKIRGFRVELREIEAALNQHPAVRESAVMLREELSGWQRLVAYVVLADAAAASAGDLRQFLKERLPDYMAPAAFVALERLPLTAHGKLDQGALPLPDEARPDLEAAYVSPHTEVERAIAAIWSEVLQVETVGIYDNFFDLGGDSMLSVRIHGRLQEALGCTVPMVKLFEHPTIAALAACVSQQTPAAPVLQSDERARKADTHKERSRKRFNQMQRAIKQRPRADEAPVEPEAGAYDDGSADALAENGHGASAGARRARPPLLTPYVEPDAELQRTIAAIWCDVLSVERVGIYDRFVDLGGYSLLAARVGARIQESMGVTLPIALLMRSNTVAALAVVVESLRGNGAAALSPPERPAAEPADELLPFRLPNGMSIFHQNTAETEQFYEDIFDQMVYIKNGVSLRDGACVFDVGANIGLFTLFVQERCPRAQVYAFEPSPPTYAILSKNAEPYGDRVRCFNQGLGSESKTADFTFYPRSSGMSTFYADSAEEKDVLRTVILNQARPDTEGMQALLGQLEEVLDERFAPVHYVCWVRTISEVIAEHDIARIDLLKIDAQKSELAILEGIAPDDWDKIDQIVMEVHDIEGRLREAVAMLQARRYFVTFEQDPLYRGSSMYNLYAIR